MLPEECVVCPGLGVLKKEKQHLVENRSSILASVNNQEHGRRGMGLEPQANILSLHGLSLCSDSL